MKDIEIKILKDFIYNDDTEYCYDWHGFDYKTIFPIIEKILNEYKKQKEVIDKANKYLHIRGIQQWSNGTHYRGLDGLQVQVLEDILKEVSK